MRVRRDVLRRMIEKGNTEARISYSYDGRVVTKAGDTPWKPARIMGSPKMRQATDRDPTRSAWSDQDWIDGYFNFNRIWFTSKTGWATKVNDNLWEIHFCNESVQIRIKDEISNISP